VALQRLGEVGYTTTGATTAYNAVANPSLAAPRDYGVTGIGPAHWGNPLVSVGGVVVVFTPNIPTYLEILAEEDFHNSALDQLMKAGKVLLQVAPLLVGAPGAAGFTPSWAVSAETQLGWRGAEISLARLSSEELSLVEDVLNAPSVLVGRSVNATGQGQLVLDNWLVLRDIAWNQRWQDVYNKALYLRTASGLPVNVLAGGGYTLGEVGAAEAGARVSGIFNTPFWPYP
jgi:hypothetical protein